MKKIISLFTAIVLALSPFTVAFAGNTAQDVTLSMYCNRYDADEISGKYKNNTFYLHIDVLCEMTGSEITDVEDKKIFVSSERYCRIFEINFRSQKMADNWIKGKYFTMPCFEENGEKYVSALHFLRYLGAKVKISQDGSPQLIVHFKYNIFEALAEYVHADYSHYFMWDEMSSETENIDNKILNAGLVALIKRDSNVFRMAINPRGIEREAIEEVLTVIVKNEGQDIIKDKSALADANTLNKILDTGNEVVDYLSEFEEMELDDNFKSKFGDNLKGASAVLDAFNAAETMEQFRNISESQMNLLQNTMIDNKADSEFLEGDGSNYYNAAVNVNSRIKSEINNNFLAQMSLWEQNSYNALEEAIGVLGVNPVSLAWDVAMLTTGLTASDIIDKKTDFYNAYNASVLQMIANDIFVNTFDRLEENNCYINDLSEQEAQLNSAKNSLILQIKSTITTRQYLIKSRFLDESYQRDMEEMLQEAVVILNRLENCKIVSLGVNPVVDEDLSWMAGETEKDSGDTVIDDIISSINGIISGEEPEEETEAVEIKSYGYAETVMDSLDEWETVDGDFCTIIQLYELDGDYYMYCLYSRTAYEKTNAAVSKIYTKVTYRYLVTEDSFGSGEKVATPMYEGYLGTMNLLGSTLFYQSDTYEEKYDSILHLFNNLYEQGLEQ